MTIAALAYQGVGQLVDGGDMSGDITSGILDVSQAEGSIQLISASGSRNGPIYLQGSNNGTDWTNLTLEDGTDNVPVAASTALSRMLFLTGIGCRFVRLFWDVTSGTGTLNAYAFLKKTVR